MALLGGRVVHEQAVGGHRTGIEPVILAASVAVRAGERVLEGGAGSGAALLCLAHRVAGVAGLGLEVDPAQVELARANAAANGFAGLAFETADLTAWRGAGGFDHAMANPPWHAAAATPSPDPAKSRAKRADVGLFAAWATALARPLRHRGTLTFIVGADHLAPVLAAMTAAGCGSPTLFPLWPRPGVPARLLLLRAAKGGHGPARVLPGLALHQQDGGYTPEAAAILRDGAALPF
jgi:tRNA1(Val) A37 N6-methylase TrmN6